MTKTPSLRCEWRVTTGRYPQGPGGAERRWSSPSPGDTSMKLSPIGSLMSPREETWDHTDHHAGTATAGGVMPIMQHHEIVTNGRAIKPCQPTQILPSNSSCFSFKKMWPAFLDFLRWGSDLGETSIAFEDLSSAMSSVKLKKSCSIFSWRA